MQAYSLTTLREKVVKIGTKFIAHAHYTIIQRAKVAAPRHLFGRILKMINDLRPPTDSAVDPGPDPALVSADRRGAPETRPAHADGHVDRSESRRSGAPAPRTAARHGSGMDTAAISAKVTVTMGRWAFDLGNVGLNEGGIRLHTLNLACVSVRGS